MVHARYRPFEWMQVHFAYTQTLNYPDYSTLTPRYLISQSTIDYNNHAIKPAVSENLDLVVSVLNNEIGLLSVSGFKKKIKDLVFFTHTFETNLSKYPDLPQGTSSLYTFNTYINNPRVIDLYGIETEWQTHFWYLPKPFDGLVLNVNYTHIFSEASYPKTNVYTEYDDEGNFNTTKVDTFYTTRMLNQPNDVANVALGYDLGGFSLQGSRCCTRTTSSSGLISGCSNGSSPTSMSGGTSRSSRTCPGSVCRYTSTSTISRAKTMSISTRRTSIRHPSSAMGCRQISGLSFTTSQHSQQKEVHRDCIRCNRST